MALKNPEPFGDGFFGQSAAQEMGDDLPPLFYSFLPQADEGKQAHQGV